MGVQNLKKVEHKGIVIKNLFVERTVEQLSGCTIYIDAMYMIHRYLHARKESETQAHLDMILFHYLLGTQHNITFVWVFDPVAAPTLKKEELEERALRGPSIVNKDIVLNAKELVALLGMRIIQCSAIEAEHSASLLSRQTNSYVLSADTDVLMYGGNLLVPERNGTYSFCSATNLLASLDLSQEQFVDLCLMLGTDYADKTPRVGPKRVTDIVKAGNYTLTERQLEAKKHILLSDDDGKLPCEEEPTHFNQTKTLTFLTTLGFTSKNNLVAQLISEWDLTNALMGERTALTEEI